MNNIHTTNNKITSNAIKYASRILSLMVTNFEKQNLDRMEPTQQQQLSSSTTATNNERSITVEILDQIRINFLEYVQLHLKKPLNYANKILQDVLMNYFLENYMSEIIKEGLHERSQRSVRYRLEQEIPKNYIGPKYMQLLNYYIDLIQAQNKGQVYEDLLKDIIQQERKMPKFSDQWNTQIRKQLLASLLYKHWVSKDRTQLYYNLFDIWGAVWPCNTLPQRKTNNKFQFKFQEANSKNIQQIGNLRTSLRTLKKPVQTMAEDEDYESQSCYNSSSMEEYKESTKKRKQSALSHSREEPILTRKIIRKQPAQILPPKKNSSNKSNQIHRPLLGCHPQNDSSSNKKRFNDSLQKSNTGSASLKSSRGSLYKRSQGSSLRKSESSLKKSQGSSLRKSENSLKKSVGSCKTRSSNNISYPSSMRVQVSNSAVQSQQDLDQVNIKCNKQINKILQMAIESKQPQHTQLLQQHLQQCQRQYPNTDTTVEQPVFKIYYPTTTTFNDKFSNNNANNLNPANSTNLQASLQLSYNTEQSVKKFKLDAEFVNSDSEEDNDDQKSNEEENNNDMAIENSQQATETVIKNLKKDNIEANNNNKDNAIFQQPLGQSQKRSYCRLIDSQEPQLLLNSQQYPYKYLNLDHNFQKEANDQNNNSNFNNIPTAIQKNEQHQQEDTGNIKEQYYFQQLSNSMSDQKDMLQYSYDSCYKNNQDLLFNFLIQH